MRHLRRTAMLVVPVVLVAVTSACQDKNSAENGSDGATTEARVVEVATDIKLAEDGSVSWTVAKIDTSGNAEPNVVAVSDATDSARFAEKVDLLTPEGCAAPFGEIKVDGDGLGQTPCTWETYQQVDHYAPKIWLDADGNITRIADRYHP